MAIVTFPDGTRVRAASLADRRADDSERVFGLYLDARWAPTWPADVIAWPDFGLPVEPDVAAGQITDAFLRARRGELVEVGCLGGSGRTGTALACMAVLAGVPPAEAVPWVRAAYRQEAVETADQEAWVQWFAGWARSDESGLDASSNPYGRGPSHQPGGFEEMAQSLKSVHAITLFVEDQQRSKEFYERAFEVTAVDEENGTVIFKFDNFFLRLLTRGEAEREMLGQVPLADSDSGASSILAIFVDDVDALCTELAERGVPIAYGPVDRPWGVRNAAFRDPDGHLWAVSADIPGD